jgi:hypothetical protein
MTIRTLGLSACLTTLIVVGVGGAPPQRAAITSPKAALGFDIGDDYQLANYSTLSAYWKTLAQESDRIRVVEYGRTSEGRPMLMAVVTSRVNHQRIDHYRTVAKRLALAEGLTDDQARALAVEGKAVVWIDAGLHATEVANTQALTEMLYQMAARDDRETLKILDEVILLAAFSNPDGLELVADWYNREREPTRRSLANLPVLYQKYIGHDNNRESLLANMPESESIAKVCYREWFPQIVFNQHQSGPAGAVLFVGAMRDPSNPYLDPLMAPSMELVSAAVHTRFVSEGKPGAVARSGASYQNWWNGGVRSTACFHNEIGILSEITGSPTPTEITFVPKNLIMSNDNPYPIGPQPWRFRQAIEYLLSANRAILSLAAEHRESFLYNIYRMGRNSIDKASRDSWTMTAKKVANIQAAAARDGVTAGGRSGTPRKYFDQLHDPATRDARGYVIPSDQPDFLTAIKFVNALIKNGVTVLRASRPFQLGGRSYPANSFVVKAAQAFRPHVMDCFEPQDYPDDFAYPGGPPIRPYDVTGYTLAFQMGVGFDRVLDAIDGPFEAVEGFAVAAPGFVATAGAGGYLLSHQPNDAFIAVNRLLAAGESVYWLKGAGTIYIPIAKSTTALVQAIARDTGLRFERAPERPAGEALRLKPVRIGVADVYGGSMPSGWLQWLFTQFGFPFEVVYPGTLDAGGLATRFDVLVFENGLIPDFNRTGGGSRSSGPDPLTIPEEYRARLGAMTRERTLPALQQFLADGGTIVAIGSSTSLAGAIGVPIANALVDPKGQPLPGEQFYIPGSVLQVHVDPSHPIGYGLPERLDVFYDNNPVFARPSTPGIRTIAWFDSANPVRSGWAWGQQRLEGATAVADVSVGPGRLILLGPLVAFRAHPHGTFKLLFNSVYYAKAEAARLR